MTDDDNRGTPDTEQEFEQALTDLIVDAVLAGVSVKGAWDISRDDVRELPDFTVEIYEIDRT